MRLLIYEPSFRRLAGDIAALGPGVEPLLMSASGEVTLNGAPVPADQVKAEAAWTNADVFFGPCARAFMVAMLKSPGLKWVQSGAAGFDNAVFGQIVQKGATLTTSHGQALGMAEYVLAGVLDAFQHGPERRAKQAAGLWERVAFREINGSRWLIVGFGAIGKGVADRARAFGAHVTGVRRSQEADPSADRIAAMSDLLALLPDSDVVVLCCPLTAETRHVANTAFFDAMKPGAVLVNVGRGGLVDEPALLAALDRGVPHHAVLDVFEVEPLPADSPFWAHPRVSLTPHASGVTDGQHVRNDQLFLENLRRYVAGEPLKNVADPKDVLAGR
ncbi:MAG: D-2-hydroxyacid dehydrogenase [Phenylobacterium sp.]|nr:D-2-hydroxyacid dehydrogenase [Phenylobacterium sp.]